MEKYLHCDEVEVFGPGTAGKNLALRRPAHQVSLSQWSADHRPEDFVCLVTYGDPSLASMVLAAYRQGSSTEVPL